MIHVVGNMASGCHAHILNQSHGPDKFYLSSSINNQGMETLHRDLPYHTYQNVVLQLEALLIASMRLSVPYLHVLIQVPHART